MAKKKKMTREKFRRKMNFYGMSRYAGSGLEVWSGGSKSGRWQVSFSKPGKCSVTYSGMASPKHWEDLTYEEACFKIDFNGIYFAD